MVARSGELRTDVLTGRQVLVAEARDDRPIRTVMVANEPLAADDPFLEGSEENTPGESLALRSNSSNANQPGWLTRVVPNRYPAVRGGLSLQPVHVSDSSPANGEPTIHGPAIRGPAISGLHEVVIECPDFRTQLTELSIVEFTRVLIAWQLRIQRIANSNQNVADACVHVFRNEGPGAGASLPHCHSQILALPFLSQQVRERCQRSHAFFETEQKGLFGHWLDSELADERRILHCAQHFAALCPFAGRVAWHSRICPLDHTVWDFRELSAKQLSEIAAAIIAITTALQDILGPFSHNLTLNLPPIRLFGREPWMLDLLPRLNRMAGFEFMTDTDIVTVAPERAATKIRQSVNWPDAPSPPDPVCPPGFSWRAAE